MKNSQLKHQQDQKFQKKLNHLQGFIGMPNWNLEKPPYHKIKEYEQRGRKMQAEAVQSFSKKAASWVIKSIKKAVGIVFKAKKIFFKKVYKDVVTDLEKCEG